MSTVMFYPKTANVLKLGAGVSFRLVGVPLLLIPKSLHPARCTRVPPRKSGAVQLSCSVDAIVVCHVSQLSQVKSSQPFPSNRGNWSLLGRSTHTAVPVLRRPGAHSAMFLSLSAGFVGYAPSAGPRIRRSRTHGASMAVDLPPMPPMPDTPILSGLSLPQLPSVPSIPLPAMPTLPVPQLELTGDLMAAASVADGFGSAVPPEVQADITAALAKIGADPALLFLVPIILAGAAIAKAVAEAPDQPYPALEYDAQAARRYFCVRPGVVANRALELGSASAGFGAKLAQDFLAGELERKAPQRAEELAELLEKDVAEIQRMDVVHSYNMALKRLHNLMELVQAEHSSWLKEQRNSDGGSSSMLE